MNSKIHHKEKKIKSEVANHPCPRELVIIVSSAGHIS